MHSDDTPPQEHAIDSRRAFVAAVHELLDQALARRARRMLWVDVDFADWPLDDAGLLQRLTEWLRLPQRQLQLLASDYAPLGRRAAFVTCRRLWSHAISAYAPDEEEAAQLPCLLLAEHTQLLHLPDKTHWRGFSSSEPAALRLWRERADALLQRAVPAFPVTTLGL